MAINVGDIVRVRLEPDWINLQRVYVVTEKSRNGMIRFDSCFPDDWNGCWHYQRGFIKICKAVSMFVAPGRMYNFSGHDNE